MMTHRHQGPDTSRCGLEEDAFCELLDGNRRILRQFLFAEIKRLTRQGVLEAGQIYHPPLLRRSTFANFCSLRLVRASFFY